MKKGFTLIELLAVIVILAIIALIDNNIRFAVRPDAQNQDIYLDYQEEAVLNKWYTVVGKLENSKLFLYINGERVAKLNLMEKLNHR